MKQTDTLKRLNAVMKDINGDNLQIVRALQDSVDYLLVKMEVMEELLAVATGREKPELTDIQKRRIAHQGRKLNEFVLATIELTFSPGTIYRWHRELVGKKYDSTGRPGQKKRGRKPISPEIVEKVLFLQSRNSTWGYERIASTMRYLKFDISASTVRKILDNHGIVPDPERRARGDWEQFIAMQKDVLASTDFMTVELLTPFGLSRRHVLFFMDIGTREVRLGGIAQNPDSDWTKRAALNMCDMWDGFLLGKKYLIHDRDPLFNAKFDAVLESIDIKVKKTAPFHPEMNGHMECFIKSTKKECIERLILCNDAQLHYAIKSWLEYYNRFRCHRALGGNIINPYPQVENGTITEVSFLGGLLHGYQRTAA